MKQDYCKDHWPHGRLYSIPKIVISADLDAYSLMICVYRIHEQEHVSVRHVEEQIKAPQAPDVVDDWTLLPIGEVRSSNSKS